MISANMDSLNRQIDKFGYLTAFPPLELVQSMGTYKDTPKNLELLRREYHKATGWDTETEHSTESRLKQLGLENLSDRGLKARISPITNQKGS